jgi:hypothetical protein
MTHRQLKLINKKEKKKNSLKYQVKYRHWSRDKLAKILIIVTRSYYCNKQQVFCSKTITRGELDKVTTVATRHFQYFSN